ncbi:hypothetical protein GO755_28165 [Spirosoma sp. HMF4905]|uniref:Carboxypeptidase regulatory-like domain-containing protein n=1 Tax=Spirosoma arboris TaxID=2682092 RepID=A0A7K1SJL3_9BACT|nr:carboxypeptidase-like regulatory domain-containing protein [Spirosoma arboris]MVM33943.1 hypothetical protein [Spirosoma arboris]
MKYVLELILLISLINPAWAQIDLPGDIQGQLLKPDHQPAAFVRVLIRNGCRRTVTNQYGQFTFGQLPPGQYIIRIDEPELESQREVVTVVGDQSTQFLLVVTPKLKSISADEPVWVDAQTYQLKPLSQGWSLKN